MWNLVMASQISTFYSYSFIRMPFFLLLYTGRDWRFKKVLQSKGAVTWYNVNPNSQPIGIGQSFPNHVSCCCIKQSLRFYLISINVCISTALILDLTFTPFYCRMVVRFNEDVKFANNFWQSFFSMYKL